jgi:Major Facilitator Superfamily
LSVFGLQLGSMWGIHVLLLLAAGLVLADASVVTLALPPVIAELDASVDQAAAVLGVYTFVLAVALPLVARLPARTLAVAGGLLFGVASVGCGLADSIEALLALRGVQALGGAGLLVGAFTLLDAGGVRRRVWTAVAIFGFAAGPALGGALTQAFDWRAIFLAQVPIALAASIVAFVPATGTNPTTGAASFDARGSWAPLTALALLSAALVGVLFLLVLLLVTGWSVEPLAAAAAVTVLPIAAVLSARVKGPATVRAAAGALLVAGGVLALAFLPGASLWWTVLPQAMAGAGLGLALPALAGELLPEDTAEQAANLLAIRHAGITVALILLAPVASAQLDDAVSDTRVKGAALVLDARLPPLDKLSLAGTLLADIDPVDPRGRLEEGLAAAEVDAEDRAAFDDLATRADETLVAGVQDAFAPAFAICGALALLAALVLVPRDRRVLAAGAAAAVLAGGAALVRPALAPEPVTLADPCQRRELPSTGGLQGAIQDVALVALDRAACRFGSSREELALALVDADARAEYEREYGVDPRSAGGLLGGILGF